LIEETDWLGGQITSQGVSALDEHDYIEDFGGTRSYYQLRESIRNYYRELASDPELKEPLNPGTCWVSRLSFEPRIALQTINSMLDPYIKQGLLKIFLRISADSF
ncbi:MAG: FAD-dependent oxidoreductase, partial [Rhodospirillales bacterium]|nr:FAD-dependent oxidoreductase [Rhodospirillales bacterium]